jgi:hypothetical protein
MVLARVSSPRFDIVVVALGVKDVLHRQVQPTSLFIASCHRLANFLPDRNHYVRFLDSVRMP